MFLPGSGLAFSGLGLDGAACVHKLRMWQGREPNTANTFPFDNYLTFLLHACVGRSVFV